MSRTKTALIIIALALISWLTIYNPPILNKTRLSALRLFKFPLHISQNASIKIRDFMGRIIYSRCVKENIELKKRLVRFSSQITKLKELEAENKRLKKLLDFKRASYPAGIPARVIGVESGLLSRTILIDRGRKDGIKSGMAVISEEGLVGKVVETNSTVSRVMILEDPNLKLGVIIQRTREQALFVGGLPGRVKVIYLAATSDAKEGDAVISYPSSRIFPKGLLIGYIKNIKTEGVALYKSATVKVAVDYRRLEEVLCIK